MQDLLTAGDDVMLLDGGLATELERRGHDLSDDLWSARLLLDRPDEIVATHRSYFAAGARVATTSSYQASFEGFARRGCSHDEAAALMRRSVGLAREAADAAQADDGVRRWVAASVGPYGAVLADGSEYSGDYGRSDADLRDFHGPRAEVLATSGADLLAIETIPSEQEASVLLRVLDELPEGTAAWLSITCADAATTRRGEDVERVFGLARGHERVVAVGVNCTAPEHVEELVLRGGHALTVRRDRPGSARPSRHGHVRPAAPSTRPDARHHPCRCASPGSTGSARRSRSARWARIRMRCAW